MFHWVSPPGHSSAKTTDSSVPDIMNDAADDMSNLEEDHSESAQGEPLNDSDADEEDEEAEEDDDVGDTESAPGDTSTAESDYDVYIPDADTEEHSGDADFTSPEPYYYPDHEPGWPQDQSESAFYTELHHLFNEPALINILHQDQAYEVVFLFLVLLFSHVIYISEVFLFAVFRNIANC